MVVASLISGPQVQWGWTPDGFDWIPFAINREDYSTDLDIATYCPAGTAIYVDPTGGSNDNNGRSVDTPYQTLRKALDENIACVIWIKPGVFHYENGWNGRNFSKSLAIRRWGESGDVVIGNHKAGLTWVEDDNVGRPDCWVTTFSATIGSIRDTATTDTDGMTTRIVKQASADAVQTSGGFYSDGTTVWLRLPLDRTPDEDVRVYPIAQNGWAASGTTVYLENVIFEGGSHGMRLYADGAAGKLYAKGCTFRYACQLNGVGLEGGSEGIFEDCLAYGNCLDGFKVAIAAAQLPNVVVNRCIGRYNGWGNPDMGNGHSRHNGGYTVVLNSQFHNNYGANYHDIGDCRSWILGSNAYSSRASLAARQINWAVGGTASDEGVMWLYGCETSLSLYDLEVLAACKIKLIETTYSAKTGEGRVY